MFCFGSGSKREQGTKSDNRQITKSSVSYSQRPSLVCNEEAKHVGSDFCCWPLIYSPYHLPALEPLKALSLLVEHISIFLSVKFEFLQLALFSLSAQSLLMLTTLLLTAKEMGNTTWFTC